MDGRTRHAHQALDGQVQKREDPFQSELGDIMYPSDPSAHPANVYNCRCTLVANIEGDYSDSSKRWTADIDPATGKHVYVENMTYTKWAGVQKEIELFKERGIIDNRGLALGLRKPISRILSNEEIKSIKSDAKDIEIPLDILKFNQGGRTGFSDENRLINIRGDILPDETSTIARDRMSVKAVLAHEYYGHYKSFPSQYPIGHYLDEYNASREAAINTPNLSAEERRALIIDAYDRLRENGVFKEYDLIARKLIYGY